jgi:hypothetical protein
MLFVKKSDNYSRQLIWPKKSRQFFRQLLSMKKYLDNWNSIFPAMGFCRHFLAVVKRSSRFSYVTSEKEY